MSKAEKVEKITPGQQELDQELFLAARDGSEARARSALARGASPNARDKRETDFSALCALLAHGFEKKRGGAAAMGALEALLAAGADAAQPGSLRRLSPWECAALYESPPEALSAMIKAGAIIGSKDELGRTALHHAAMKGSLEKARLLIEAGEDPRERDALGMTAGEAALEEGMVETAGAIAALTEARELASALPAATGERPAPARL